MINIENFVWNLLKIDKKSYENIDIYYNGYITTKIISDYENVHSVNPFYLIIGKADGHIEEVMEINTYVLLLQIKTKKCWKNMPNFGMRLNIWLRQLMAMKQANIEKISWKLGLSQLIICF